MKKELEILQKDFQKAISKVDSTLKLNELRDRFFSRKSGEMTAIMNHLKTLGGEAKKEMGKLANEVKKELEEIYGNKEKELKRGEIGAALLEEKIDVTQPLLPKKARGHLHPITRLQYDLEDFFRSMGFAVLDGPELETEYYNFEALNIPADHPARDMQDTFYVKGRVTGNEERGVNDRWLMRTHTSPVQVRAMQEYGAPIRAIVPGRVFRNEATDARHEHTFFQMEGLVVDTDITFSHMKGILEAVAKFLYGEETRVRLRPKYYPFVEPGVNGEVTCVLCKGAGCRVCKQTGWLEIFGAGMVHPNVLREGGIDPNKYQGFAFGFGLNRLVMLKYGIEDIRHFMSGDMRFLEQF